MSRVLIVLPDKGSHDPKEQSGDAEYIAVSGHADEPKDKP